MDWWSIIAAVFTVLAMVYYRAIRNFDFFEKRGIPHVKPMVFLGCLWKTVFQRLSFAESVEKSYNMDPESKYVGVFESDSSLLVIRDLDLIKSITLKNFDHLLNHRMAFFSTRTWSLSSRRISFPCATKDGEKCEIC